MCAAGVELRATHAVRVNVRARAVPRQVFGKNKKPVADSDDSDEEVAVRAIASQSLGTFACQMRHASCMHM